MPKTKDEVIAELVTILLIQDDEIAELKHTLDLARQHIDIYEKCIRKERDDGGDADTSGDI